MPITTADNDSEAAVAKKTEANALYKARQFEAAIALYNEALELDPEDLTYRLNKAAAYMEQGDLETAKKVRFIA